jgi:thiaminase (transcriptional activator TenA)
MQERLPLGSGLFGLLRRETGELWTSYVRHPFVLALGNGTLPQRAFQHFLRQDYLFLIQFARAYALAGYKSAGLRDLRAASVSLTAILEVEKPLHVSYCAQWGLTEDDMAAEPEALETVAYTRFVLERGMAGDLLDLQVALVPCVVGYGEAVEHLMLDPRTVRRGNPYLAWMETYAGAEYRAVALAAMESLDRLGAERGADARHADLLATFQAATRLEAAFWDMGLAAV